MDRRLLVKASGDLCGNKNAIAFVRSLALDNPLDHIVFEGGGGSHASQKLEEAGYEVVYDYRFTPPRRITKTPAEKLTVATALAKERNAWTAAFRGLANVQVVSSFQWPGGMPVNTNGDDLVWLWFTEFDATYVLTLAGRIKSKEKIFGRFPEIKIIPF